MPAKAAVRSKINWVQIIAGTLQGADLVLGWLQGESFVPAEWHAGLAVAQSALTFVLRTWFSGTPIRGVFRS